MSFNWPEIPFTGAEVEAFVNAYKGLAEYIYDEFENYMYTLESKAPYTNRESLKQLLESGLVYSSFIIQQRSGSSGPGTDFNLGNSPHRPQLSDPQKEWVLKNIGCVFDPDSMKDAWKNNGLPGNPPLFGDANDPLGNPASDDWGDGNGDPKDEKDPNECPPGSECSGNGQGGCPEGKICRNCRCVPDDCPSNPCSLTTKESLLINSYSAVGFGGIRNAKADLLTRYLTCNATQFTENNLNQGQLNEIRDEVVGIATGRIRYKLNPQVEVTGYLTSIQKTLWGMEETDRVFQIGSYGGGSLSISTLLGSCYVITNSTGLVAKGVRDDFDFSYGYERSGRWSTANTGSNSMPGTVPLPEKVRGSIYQSGCTVEQVLNSFGKKTNCDVSDGQWDANIGRKIIVEAYRCERGTPVPVYINFT